MTELIADLLLLVGGVLTLAAGVGLLRFGDALSRLHAATKPQILGLLAVLAAIAVRDQRWTTILALLPIVALQLVTTPMAAHMVGRAAYRTGNFRDDLLQPDELAAAIDAAAPPTSDLPGDAPD